jgi:DNA-binding transcriptional regulator YhcF (GntR family)
MKFWFVHSGDVSLHDQIVTQVSLGVLSGDLTRGERLPSIRAVAQRFAIHSNTVSAAYRQLEKERWVEFKRGSGVFVRDTAPKEIAGIRPALHLDRLIVNLIQSARASGVAEDELRARILGHLDKAPPAKLLLIESDVELRRIVLTELAETVTLPTGFKMGYANLPRSGDAQAISELMAQLPGTLALVLPSKAEALREVLPPAVAMHILRVRSIPTLLQPWLPAPSDALVGVASRWPPFLAFARIMLIAAGFEADALLMRDATQPEWMAGLNQARTVICDSCTASALPNSISRIKFNILAEESVDDLKKMVGASLN